LRFGNNCRPDTQREAGPITQEQRAKALQRILRQIQGIAFQPTITQLQKNGSVAVSDPYRSLDPFLDNTKVLRVGGRLQNSSLAFDEIHLSISHFLLFHHQGSTFRSGVGSNHSNVLGST